MDCTHLHIPYFQTTRIRVTAMIKLANIKPNEHAADLGAGDGRIVIALAQAGAVVRGYEIDQSLAQIATQAIHTANLNDRATIIRKDFWSESLSDYDIITIYPMPDIMDALEKKLQQELRPGARVLTNYYKFDTWKYVRTHEHVYCYIK